MVENIDSYYIVPISVLLDKGISFEKDSLDVEYLTYKYACVKPKKYIRGVWFVDLLNKEKYSYEISTFDHIGSSFIRKSEKLIPLNLFLKNKKQKMLKSNLIDIVREILFEMNKSLLNDIEGKNAMDIYNGVVLFNQMNAKVKTLKCGSKVIKYKEE